MPTKLSEVYRCRVCGNIVEIVHPSNGELVCCGQAMRLQEENTVDASQEKHVPMVEIKDNQVSVKIGSEVHPMTEEHYIEWIEVITTSGQVYRHALKPGDEPVADFIIQSDVSEVRAYCNLHGLWSK